MSYKKAFQVLQDGQIIVFPCDTVMGIGCAMNQPKAIKRLYKIKGRPTDQPTAVLVADIEMAKMTVVDETDRYLNKIMKKYWPGALTVVAEASSFVPKSILGNTSEIGIRMPDFPELRNLIKKLQVPLVATSANFRGEKTPVRFEDIKKDFLDRVDYAIQDDSTGYTASTVIKYLGNGNFEYLRKGEIKI